MTYNFIWLGCWNLEIFVERNDFKHIENYVTESKRWISSIHSNSPRAWSTWYRRAHAREKKVSKAQEFSWSPKEALSREHYFAVTCWSINPWESVSEGWVISSPSSEGSVSALSSPGFLKRELRRGKGPVAESPLHPQRVRGCLLSERRLAAGGQVPRASESWNPRVNSTTLSTDGLGRLT